MGKKGDKVYVPDAAATAAAQTQSNKDTAAYNQTLNMVNSYGPDGSVTYAADPNAPGGYSQTTSLSPAQQQLYDSQNKAMQGALDVAGQQVGRVGEALGKTLTPGQLQTSVSPGNYQTSIDPVTMGDASVQRAIDSMYGQAKSRLDPDWDTAAEQQRVRLANQGISENSDAYKTADAAFGRDRNDAYTSALNSAVQSGMAQQAQMFGQGLDAGNFANSAAGQKFNDSLNAAQFGNTAQQQNFQQQAYQQQLPINELSALIGLGQVGTPSGINYTPAGASMTDVLGAHSLQSSASAKQAEINRAAFGDLTGGLFSLGTAAIKASDRRLKEDIRQVGKLDNGLPVYLYRYKGDVQFQLGVMAQDVMEVRPDAVSPIGGGFLGVDYAKVA